MRFIRAINILHRVWLNSGNRGQHRKYKYNSNHAFLIRKFHFQQFWTTERSRSVQKQVIVSFGSAQDPIVRFGSDSQLGLQLIGLFGVGSISESQPQTNKELPSRRSLVTIIIRAVVGFGKSKILFIKQVLAKNTDVSGKGTQFPRIF